MDDDDCFIIEQTAPRVDITNLEDDSNDFVITREVGQVVACRDYPHARHLCATYPFDRTPHDFYCPKCHCFVCDQAAPCPSWGDGLSMADHCHATGNRRGMWTSSAGPSTLAVSSQRIESPYLLQDAMSVHPLAMVPVDSIEPHHSGHRYPLRPSILCRPYLRRSCETEYSCIPRREAFSSDLLWGDYPIVFRSGHGSKGGSKGGNRRARSERTQQSTALSVQVKKERVGSRRKTNVVKQEIGSWPRLLTNSVGKEPGAVKTRAKLIPKVETIAVDDSDEYEVERILDHRDVLSVQKGLQREYLVLWQGWSVQDSTWEPVSNLTNAAAILEDYLRSKDLRRMKHK